MRTPGDVLALAWHPNGIRLLLSHRSGRVTMHDTRRIGRTNSSSRPPEIIAERELNWELNAMQFMADGKSILAAYGDTAGGGVRLLSVRATLGSIACMTSAHLVLCNTRLLAIHNLCLMATVQRLQPACI